MHHWNKKKKRRRFPHLQCETDDDNDVWVQQIPLKIWKNQDWLYICCYTAAAVAICYLFSCCWCWFCCCYSFRVTTCASFWFQMIHLNREGERVLVASQQIFQYNENNSSYVIEDKIITTSEIRYIITIIIEIIDIHLYIGKFQNAKRLSWRMLFYIVMHARNHSFFIWFSNILNTSFLFIELLHIYTQRLYVILSDYPPVEFLQIIFTYTYVEIKSSGYLFSIHFGSSMY